VLLYGLDDLALIESTCFHYPKNQKLYLSLFQSFGGNTIYNRFTYLKFQ
jgi:hypothetical protein